MRPSAPPTRPSPPPSLDPASAGLAGTARLRVLHVASGGFSGATQVALDLALAPSIPIESAVALRSKKHLPHDRLQALRDAGLQIAVVPGGLHRRTIAALVALMDELQPDIVVGHGFPEHLLARRAAVQWRQTGHRVALIQVEHNARERYRWRQRAEVRELAPHTAAFVGVSCAVAQALRQGLTGAPALPAARVQAIPNGIASARFTEASQRSWEAREAAILMAARFGAQKDPLTLIRALEILERDYRLRPRLRLAGGGSPKHRAAAEACARTVGRADQVEFLGHRPDLPALMQQHRVLALSTHFEGLPLVLAEGLAAGCAVVGSDVPGVSEVLGAGRFGWLASPGSPEDWARTLAPLLQSDPSPTLRADIAQRVQAGAAHARSHLTVERMARDYHALFEAVMPQPHSQSQPQNDGPWLSLLIPACNAAETLPTLFESIERGIDGLSTQLRLPRERLPAIEVRIVDDASDDTTLETLEGQAATWTGGGTPLMLHVHRHSTRQGVAASRNRLLEEARGTWLWFLDADDRVRPGGLEAVVEALTHAAKRWPQTDALVIDHAVWRQRSGWKHRLRGEHHRRSLALTGNTVAVLPDTATEASWLAAAQWHPWGRVVRRAAWPSNLRFPEGRVFEDLDLIPRLMLQLSERPGGVLALPRAVVDYRSHGNSLLGTMHPGKVQDWAAAIATLAQATAQFAPPDRGLRHLAWMEHLALQWLRMVRVGRRLGMADEPLGLLSERIAAAAPAFTPVLSAWIWKPRRWWARRQLSALIAMAATASAPAEGRL